MDILALWSLSLHWIGPDWAFSRPLSGGSGWPHSGGGGVRKGHQHCCVGKLMSEVEMTLHNFDTEHCTRLSVRILRQAV